MAGKTRYLENKILNHVLRGTTYTSPGTVYLGLFTTAPSSDTNSGTEVSGGAYVRKAVTFAEDSPTALGRVYNSAIVEFPTATGNWGTIKAWGIFDAASGGNLLYWGTIEDTAVTTNMMVKVLPQTIKILED